MGEALCTGVVWPCDEDGLEGGVAVAFVMVKLLLLVTTY